MPIYEYRCQSCGMRFEKLRSMNDSDSEIKCPACGVDNPQRILSSFARGSSGGSSGVSCAPGSS